MKSNATSVVGQLYEPGDIRRDAGFSLYYLGINLGALFGPLLAPPARGLVIGRLAQTLDGRIATRSGNSKWIGGAGDLRAIGSGNIGTDLMIKIMRRSALSATSFVILSVPTTVRKCSESNCIPGWGRIR